MVDEIAADVTERTTLGRKRTLLAWWRSRPRPASAVADGRPPPSSGMHRPWASAYACYGIGLIVYGTSRGRDVETAPTRRSSESRPLATRWGWRWPDALGPRGTLV